jgi:outer membrane receptor protein involved in Fe transport
MRQIGVGRTVGFGAALVALLFGGGQLAAQGVTSAAVQGRITSESRGTVENAIVALINTSTGARQQTSTNSSGRYNFENTTPGGPYTIDVRSIGFQAASKTGIMLTLGQRYVQDFELKQQVVTLEELTVVAATNPLINSGRTGAGQTVSDTAIQRLPLLGRNFTDLLRTSPQVLSGSGIGGQNSRYNTILIDGGVNNDIFGLSSGGTPGGTAGAKPISLEALQEFQILSAPFDIRQGSFSGGLVNGITKSGTNQFHGSLFGYAQRPELVGKDTARLRVGTFDIKQYGGTFSGPIIKNKLHFFGSADVQSSQTAFFGLSAAEPSTGITVATANRVQQIIIDKFGFDPGGSDPPSNLGRPDKNLFGKLTWQAAASSQLEVSYNYTKASQDNFSRGSNRTDPTRDGWQLSKSGFTIGNTTNSARAKFTSLIGGGNLELLFGYQTVRDARTLPNNVPLILVQGDILGNYLAAGGEKFSHGNELDQDNFEATGNFTFSVGGNHQITVGTHNEFFKFRNLFAANRYGTWTFANVDSLDANVPRRYELLIETREGGFTSRFNVRQLGAYIQDSWRPSDRLTLTGGVRYDVPIFANKPFENPLPALVNDLGIHTGQFPSGNGLFSPRVGFNWDPFGNGNTITRGGVGLFSGRPPYVWMSNAFTNTGLEQVTLICGRDGTTQLPPPPPLTVDINNLPRSCVGQGEPAPPAANINYFEKDFKFQQALKVAFGVDQRLPGGMVATFDFLHTKNVNQMYQVDDNVVPGAINVEGRLLYGAPNAAGTALVRGVKTTGVRQVVHHLNKSRDYATLLTGQLQKSFASGLTFSGSYTHSVSKDLMTLTSSIATSNLRFTSLDGTLEDRNLRTSGFSVPHKFALSGSANLPFGIQLSAIFTARSGLPYAWTYNADVNGDGNTGNDLLYVPKDINDLTLAVPTSGTLQGEWDRLNAFIVSEKCLREQRGRIMERNSCRNPWQKFVDMRIAKVIPTMSGQSFQLTADVFNLANLLDKDWGLLRETGPNEEVNVLTFPSGSAFASTASYDNRGTASLADDRPRLAVPSTFPAQRRVSVSASRWRIQVGGKYIF